VAGAIAGTPRYMSPEQVEGRDADLRADIYSLGIVLYEALTGVQPFDGNTIAEILRRQVTEPMPRLTEANPALDFSELDTVIQRATSKKREDRWPDMLAFADALSQAKPAQSELSVPPLQRSGFSRVNATPSPGYATSSSGIAVPGAPVTDIEASGQTMLKGSTPAVTRPGGPPASMFKAGLGTELEGRSPPPGVGDLSLAPVAPKSKAPMMALGAMALVLAAGAVWVLTRANPPETVTVAPPLPPAAEVVDAAVVGAAPTNSDNEVALAATRMVREEFAVGKLGAGRDAFEVAKLDEAETYLRTIGQDTPSSSEAQALLAKIKRIKDRLSAARGFERRGDCPSALAVYREVLSLNANVSDAISGASRCQAAIVNPTMDP